jgi:hypothetical protein
MRVVKLFAFVALGLGAVLGADLSQAIGENFLAAEENQMHSMVNQTRASNGRAPVASNDALRWIARRQTQAMASAGYIYHSSDLAQQADARALPWTTLGENVGKGPGVNEIQQAFLNSPTHRENILHRDFNALGVGGMADPQQVMYFTQTFAGLDQAAAPAAPQAAPQQAAPQQAAPPPVTARAPTAAPATAPPTAPPVTAAPTPDQIQAPATPEVLGDQTEGADQKSASAPGDDAPPERPGLLRLLVAMLGRFAEKITFWQ